MISKNIIKVRKNRFKFNPSFVDEEYTSYRFVFSGSINIEEDYFTNFLTSWICKEGINLKKIIDSFKDDIVKTMNQFEGDYLFSNKKSDRLIRILRASYPGCSLLDSDIPSKVIKLKYSKFKPIQFFIYNNNNVLEVYLIDVYHLAIPTEHPSSGKEDPKGIYRAKSNAKCNISEIISDV